MCWIPLNKLGEWSLNDFSEIDDCIKHCSYYFKQTSSAHTCIAALNFVLTHFKNISKKNEIVAYYESSQCMN